MLLPQWEQLASLRVEIRDNDNRGWASIAYGGVADRPWAEAQQDLYDVLEAWRYNFLIRQIVRLTTAYVVGDKVKLTSDNPEVDTFIQAFWRHPENHLDTRLSAWCDELTRSGELFPILFTDRLTGMSYTRIIPASAIIGIETDPEDYETELTYHEKFRYPTLEPRTWKSNRTAKTRPPAASGRRYRPEPMMLHYTINKPVGATRGEGDLTPILPWARRYTEWLKDRVRFNRLRTELNAIHIEISDDSKVEEKRRQYEAQPPTGGSITVTSQGEKITFPSANIQAYDAEPDGRAIRLAVAAGANTPIHFLAEGSSATRSTAAEMGDPTHRHYRMRQKDFAGFLVDLCTMAWRRFELVNSLTPIPDPQIKAGLSDISRADNQALSTSAKTIVEALAAMKSHGWVTDDLAIGLAFKFAGEALTHDQIMTILNSKKGETANGSTG